MASSSRPVVDTTQHDSQDSPTPTRSHTSLVASPQSSSPAEASTHALARFEFGASSNKSGSSNARPKSDASKVLMVEWSDTRATAAARDKGKWHINWRDQDHEAVVPAKEPTEENKDGSGHGHHRVYILLPEGQAVPPDVTLSFQVDTDANDSDSEHDHTDPLVELTVPTLPAIYPPALVQDRNMHGKQGVLHTLWAKSRLVALNAELQASSAAELQGHGEDIENSGAAEQSRQQTIKERDWVCREFGIDADYQSKTTNSSHRCKVSSSQQQPPTTPTSSSPRLMDKMRGLGMQKLGTKSDDLAHGTSIQPPNSQPRGSNTRSPTMTSLNAALASMSTSGGDAANTTGAAATGTGAATGSDERDSEEEELFALPMSPRSPDMAVSPFSWDIRDLANAKAHALRGAS